jgi:hypothetical protein
MLVKSTTARDKVFGELPQFNITPYIIVLSEHHNAIVQASFEIFLLLICVNIKELCSLWFLSILKKVVKV